MKAIEWGGESLEKKAKIQKKPHVVPSKIKIELFSSEIWSERPFKSCVYYEEEKTLNLKNWTEQLHLFLGVMW